MNLSGKFELRNLHYRAKKLLSVLPNDRCAIVIVCFSLLYALVPPLEELRRFLLYICQLAKVDIQDNSV